jgi:hypothetical protein
VVGEQDDPPAWDRWYGYAVPRDDKTLCIVTPGLSEHPLGGGAGIGRIENDDFTPAVQFKVWDHEPDRQEQEDALAEAGLPPLLPSLEEILGGESFPASDQSPFHDGDIICYVTPAGHSVAFWVIRHHIEQRSEGESKSPIVQLLALGRPELPAVSALVRGLPARHRARMVGFDRREILDSVAATGENWRVLANVPWDNRPYYALGSSTSGWTTILAHKKPDAALHHRIWIDDAVEIWRNSFADLYDDQAAISAIDHLSDISTTIGRADTSWTESQLDELVAQLTVLRARLVAGDHLTRDDERKWVELTLNWGAQRELHDLDIYRLGQTYSMSLSELIEYPPGDAFAEIAAKHVELSEAGMRSYRSGAGPSAELVRVAAEFRSLRPLGWEANASKITATPPGRLWDEIRNFDMDFYDFLRWEGSRGSGF